MGFLDSLMSFLPGMGGGGESASSVLSNPGTTFMEDPNAFSSVPYANNSAASEYTPGMDWTAFGSAIAHGAGEIGKAALTRRNPLGVTGSSAMGRQLQNQNRVPTSALLNVQGSASNMASIERRLHEQFSYTPQRIYKNFSKGQGGTPLGPLQKVPTSSELAAYKVGYRYGG